MFFVKYATLAGKLLSAYRQSEITTMKSKPTGAILDIHQVVLHAGEGSACHLTADYFFPVIKERIMTALKKAIPEGGFSVI